MFTRMNKLGGLRKPFVFIINFNKTRVHVYELHDIPSNVFLQFEERLFGKKTKSDLLSGKVSPVMKMKKAVNYKKYLLAFDTVMEEMRAGNTYLLNLTFPTSVDLTMTLPELFFTTQAKFKCCFADKFLSFSPERFIKMENDKIFTYPMKGTSPVKEDDYGDKLMQSEKEETEHLMIVDLLRNDLDIVAGDVRVEKFRYKEKINTGSGSIWQTSSEVCGRLNADWHENIGNILNALLPAGSISGTPKPSTLEIIKKLEQDSRGYYTGIFGYYDGEMLDSAVAIRFVESNSHGYFYRSGGGLTIDSEPQKEYQELLDKVYLPVLGKKEEG
ncbi:MAG: aminodeoxychorismate synthase component I [Candidatus Margulisbacteria bacterium]|nr:aminodeoxychorismate synthase component I [Candidatus Margulisiibacteriota bacterium]